MLQHFPGSRADQSGEDTIWYSMISLTYSLKTIQMNRIYMQNRNKFTEIGASLMAHWWTHLPMKEMWVQSLGQEDTLEEEMATHSSIFAWRIPWTEDPGRLHTVHEVAKSQTQLSNWISNSPLELRESLGSWNIFSHKQEMGGQRKAFATGDAPQNPAQFLKFYKNESSQMPKFSQSNGCKPNKSSCFERTFSRCWRDKSLENG